MLKSETKFKIDSESFNFNDVKIDSISELELKIDLGHLLMENQIDLTFDDLLNKAPNNKDNLYILSLIRLMLHPGGILNLINTYKGTIDKSYLTRMEILLNKAGFIDIEIRKTSSVHQIRTVRRQIETEDLNYGLTLKEIILPDEISRCHQFAKDFYYYKDFNYDLDVVKPFDLNCDHFAVYDEDGEILSL
ncbi:MAG: hypothetical protein PF693_14955 [Spirochaetia bacterium]|nr:hypothetical protein [Spirochaetia bacterium]